MKNFYRNAALCLTLVAALFVGCSESATDADDQSGTNPDDSNSTEIVFPEAGNYEASIDGEYTITFEASTMWSALSSVSWIEFKDGNDLYSSISGKASDQAQITFVVNDNELNFSDAQGTITLTMGDESAVIANVSRQGLEPTITLYSLDMTTYEEYEITTDDIFAIEWSENGFNFSRKLRFVTNFDWVIEDLPAWISNPDSSPLATAGSAGDEFSNFLSTDYSQYSDQELMEATMTITSEDNPEISYPLTLTTPGSKSMMKVTAIDSYSGFAFDADGNYGSSLDGTTNSTYNFDYLVESNPEACPELLISCSVDEAGEYYFDDQSTWADSWLFIDEREESVAYGQYLSHIYCEVSVLPNESETARYAAIIALPSSLYSSYATVADLYDASTGALKAEVEPYLISYVSQKAGLGAPELELAWDPMGITATISRLDASWGEYYDFYQSEYGIPADALYVLEFSKSGAAQVLYPVDLDWYGDSINVYPLVEGESITWLSIEGAETYFTVYMSASSAAAGTIIVNQDGENVVAIHCVQLQ